MRCLPRASLQVRKPPLKETTGEMVGVFRMYNVGQDTRFNPGGDKQTSYMYELGFDKKYHGQSEQWAETVRFCGGLHWLECSHRL